MLQNKLFQEFLKFCLSSLIEYKQITFNEYPKITLTVHKNKVQTLASFNPSTNEIICYTPKRLVADVFRSIAHELVHFAQNMKQELSQKSGDTGSDIENEANSLAGIIMRDFGKSFPQIFVTSFDEMVQNGDSKYEKLLHRKYGNSEQIENARGEMDNYLKSLFPITEESVDNKTSLNGISLIKTGTPFLDQMIENPSYYFFNKQIEARIEIMSPQEYLDKCGIMQNNKDDIENSSVISQENLKKYADKIKSGEIFPLPYLDYSSKGQEGRHRAIVLKRLGVQEMPVLIINKVSDTIISTYSKFIKNNYNTFEEANKFILKNLKFKLDERSFNDIIKGYINEATNNKHKFGCLMLKLNFKNWNKFLEQIPEDKLYTEDGDDSYGKEFEPHVTVLYGFTENNDVNKIKKSIKTLKKSVKLSLNKIDLFENEKFDVVKFNVISKDLHKLHKIFATNFENKESYPTYEPHCTIAYVKKGFGKDFVTNLKHKIELESSEFIYSEQDDTEHLIGIDDINELTDFGAKYLDECDCEIENNRKTRLDEYAQKVVDKLVTKFMNENPNVTEKIAIYYINRFPQISSSPKVTQKDITQYSFKDLEKLVDSFPTKMKSQSKSGDSNNVEFSDGELIYNKSPLQIFHGDSPKQCIKIKGNFGASWCIARTSGNMYHNYRFGRNEPSFYFVKNLERLNKIKKLSDDPYCFFVIQIDINGKYIVTSALNNGDKEMTWEQLVQIEPLLNGTDKLFVQKALSDEDKVYYKRFKNGISDEEYKDLSFEEKKRYIAITNKLSNNQFKNTPDELINDYISIGSTLSDQQLDLIKNRQALLNNYRRVTISLIPEYLNDDIYMDNRWSVLTDDEIIDIYKKRKSDISDIIRYKPTMIKYFKNDLSELGGNGISYILMYNPSLVKYFEKRLESLNANQISRLISYQPKFIKYFEDKIYIFNSAYMREILEYQPSVVKYFEKFLWKLTDIDLLNVLKKQPQLTEYIENVRQNFVKECSLHQIKILLQVMPTSVGLFKNRLTEFDDKDVKEIVGGNPELKKYFNKKSDIDELIKLGEYFLTKNGDETYENFDKVDKTNFLSECDCEDIEDEEINELLKI